MEVSVQEPMIPDLERMFPKKWYKQPRTFISALLGVTPATVLYFARPSLIQKKVDGVAILDATSGKPAIDWMKFAGYSLLMGFGALALSYFLLGRMAKF